MPKYANILGKRQDDIITEKEEQKKLKKKYDIEDPNIKVVEKSNMVKFTIKTIKGIIYVLCTIVIITLAIIGLAALCYESPRAELLIIMSDTIEHIKTSFGLRT